MACSFTGTSDSNKNEFRKNIPLGRAKEVKTEISFAAGELNISPCSNHLAEGNYTYSKEELKPEITYTEESKIGHLRIEAFDEDMDMDKNMDNKDSCRWNIGLNKNIQNDLDLEMLAGEGNIDLHGCNIIRFDMKMLAGDLDVDLRNTSVPRLKFKALVGQAVIDLSGKWENDLDADIKGGVGEITLKLPSKVGTKITIVGILGDIDAPDFKKHNNTYTNAAYGNTDQTLYIELTGGLGNVNVELVE